MEFDADVLDIRMADMVLGESACSIIVAKKRGGSGRSEAKSGEEFTKERKFVRGVVQGDVFSIT